MAAAAFTLFTGCAGQNISTPSAATPSVGSGLNARDAATQSGPTLYVLSRTSLQKPDSSVDAVYSGGGKSLLRRIKRGNYVVTDSSGNLYVASNPIRLYTDSGKTLVEKFQNGRAPERIGNDGAITADGLGNFYVTCGHHELCEYSIGNQTPVRTLSANEIGSIATDAAGNLYLGHSYGQVYIYAPGSTTPTVITNGVYGPEALAVDAQGNLYVANANSATNHIPNIVVYAPGAKSPTRSITSGVTNPLVIHCDGKSNLFVMNVTESPTMTVYASGTSTPKATISDGLQLPTAFAFDSSSNLYVANGGEGFTDLGSVTVYSAGNYALLRTVTKDLVNPMALGVGP
ncbi:MAG: hypothetical protein WB615_03750 [Candidatus Tumulicola sp.]